MPLVVLEARLYPLGSLISLTVLWGYPMGTSTRNIWIYGFGLSTSRHPWTSASDHTTQGGQICRKKIGRGTLDLELTLSSYSGAPKGPRASP